MNVFTNEELADMHMMYGQAKGSSNKARRLYAARFPHRRLPHSRIFVKLHIRLRETGSVKVRKPERAGVTKYGIRFEDKIFALAAANPPHSIRSIARTMKVAPATISRILNQKKQSSSSSSSSEDEDTNINSNENDNTKTTDGDVKSADDNTKTTDGDVKSADDNTKTTDDDVKSANDNTKPSSNSEESNKLSK